MSFCIINSMTGNLQKLNYKTIGDSTVCAIKLYLHYLQMLQNFQARK